MAFFHIYSILLGCILFFWALIQFYLTIYSIFLIYLTGGLCFIFLSTYSTILPPLLLWGMCSISLSTYSLILPAIQFFYYLSYIYSEYIFCLYLRACIYFSVYLLFYNLPFIFSGIFYLLWVSISVFVGSIPIFCVFCFFLSIPCIIYPHNYIFFLQYKNQHTHTGVETLEITLSFLYLLHFYSSTDVFFFFRLFIQQKTPSWLNFHFYLNTGNKLTYISFLHHFLHSFRPYTLFCFHIYNRKCTLIYFSSLALKITKKE